MMYQTFFGNVKDLAKQHEGKHLSLPKIPDTYLALHFDKKLCLQSTPSSCKGPTPFCDSEIVPVKLIDCKRVTKEDPDVKKTLELTLEFCDKQIPYQPGDSFGFLCQNSEIEVDELLDRLHLLDYADVPYEIEVNENFKSKKKIPAHIPTCCTLRRVFTSSVDIRYIPKKVFLHILSTYCDDLVEQQTLQFLSSREGSEYYTNLVVEQMLTFQDILMAFQSCNPPVVSLIEHLPVLKPRFYSVANSPLESCKTFKIVFNVIEIRKSDGHHRCRKGVCTSWLEKLSENFIHKADLEDSKDTPLNSLSNGISNLTLNTADEEALPCILVYRRRNDHFLLPESLETPIIMVGPGTGVAPFIGFLHHRKQQIQSCGNVQLGEMWLIYGCRYEENDFLYSKELHQLKESGVLSNLLTCFSRDELSSNKHSPRYVQDLIRIHAQLLSSLIESGAMVYVCGDARNMAKDVRCSFIEIIKEFKEYSSAQAEDLMKKLEESHKYCVDVWA